MKPARGLSVRDAARVCTAVIQDAVHALKRAGSRDAADAWRFFESGRLRWMAAGLGYDADELLRALRKRFGRGLG